MGSKWRPAVKRRTHGNFRITVCHRLLGHGFLNYRLPPGEFPTKLFSGLVRLLLGENYKEIRHEVFSSCLSCDGDANWCWTSIMFCLRYS